MLATVGACLQWLSYGGAGQPAASARTLVRNRARVNPVAWLAVGLEFARSEKHRHGALNRDTGYQNNIKKIP